MRPTVRRREAGGREPTNPRQGHPPRTRGQRVSRVRPATAGASPPNGPGRHRSGRLTYVLPVPAGSAAPRSPWRKSSRPTCSTTAALTEPGSRSRTPRASRGGDFVRGAPAAAASSICVYGPESATFTPRVSPKRGSRDVGFARLADGSPRATLDTWSPPWSLSRRPQLAGGRLCRRRRGPVVERV
jgi:hypothetical protein